MNGGIEITESHDTEAMLEQLEIGVREVWAKKATKAGAQVAVNEAKQRAPRSSRTGTADKHSAKTKAKRAGKKSLKSSIKALPATNENGVISTTVTTGPLGHLVENDHEQVLWGRRTGAKVRGKKFFVPAVEATEAEQQHAIKGTLQRGMVEGSKNG